MNDDLRLTFSYFTTMPDLVTCVLELGKQVHGHSIGKTLQKMTKLTEDLCLRFNLVPIGQYPGAMYMYKTILFEHHLFNHRFANQSQNTCGSDISLGGKGCLGYQCHYTKMAAMPNARKNCKNLRLRNQRVSDLTAF